MIWCEWCEEFHEEEYITEETGVVAPDGYKETMQVEVCSHCGSDDVHEASICELCGEPYRLDKSDYCPECKELAIKQFWDMFDKLAHEHGEEKEKSIINMMGEAFEEWSDRLWASIIARAEKERR